MHKKNKTKAKILLAAKHSFYERGYSATTYSLLAKELKTSPGSFSYHFSSKAFMAGLIYNNILTDLSAIAKNKYLKNKHNPILHYALVCRLLTFALANDPKFFRFYYEFGKDDIVIACDYTLLKIIEPAFIKNKKETDLIYTITKGLSWLSNVAYLTQKIDCNYQCFDDYLLETKLKILNFNPEEIKDVLKLSKELVDNDPLIIYPYFKFK